MPKNLALALLAISTTLSAQTISTKTAGMKHIDGFLPLDWDAKTGKLYLEIPHLGPDSKSPDILYTHSLPYGTGSNDLGLDRGQTSRGQL
ncbi:MAG TPA: peptidase, partial [Edaphobacter sp.]|nr:peptidase [Edaphobacter sp.]